MWRWNWGLRFVWLGMGLRGRRLIGGSGLGGREMVLRDLLLLMCECEFNWVEASGVGLGLPYG